MDKDYKNFRENVFNGIKRYQILMEIYTSYEKNIWGEREKLNIIVQRYESVLYFLGNALITDIYVTLRRLLSKGKNELSLYQFHQRYLMPQICATTTDEFEKSALKCILPNSVLQWEELKKFIDKRVAHLDKGKKIEPFPVEKTKIIFEDLKSAFDTTTLKVEDATYSFDKDDILRLSDIVFNRMIHSKKSDE